MGPGCTLIKACGAVTPIFFGEKGYAQISQTAKYYIGLLRHAAALLGLCAPTTNSYRRLVPGFEAGILPAQPVGRCAHPRILQQIQIQTY